MDAIPRRKYGKHDVSVSALGLGGASVGRFELYKTTRCTSTPKKDASSTVFHRQTSFHCAQ